MFEGEVKPVGNRLFGKRWTFTGGNMKMVLKKCDGMI